MNWFLGVLSSLHCRTQFCSAGFADSHVLSVIRPHVRLTGSLGWGGIYSFFLRCVLGSEWEEHLGFKVMSVSRK